MLTHTKRAASARAVKHNFVIHTQKEEHQLIKLLYKRASDVQKTENGFLLLSSKTAQREQFMLLATSKVGVELEKYRQKKLLKTELYRVIEACEEMFAQIEPSGTKLVTKIDYENEIKKHISHISYVFIDFVENHKLLNDEFINSLKDIANRNNIRIELFVPTA